MLAEMRIQGLGVIDDATLDLDPGLTVLTGETGAGKTMVVTGLTLLGGGRAEASRVADGARRAVVEGRFSAAPAALAVADEVGAEPDDDGTLIAVRTVGADGRSRAHLGGRSVPVGVLGRLAEATLAVHGQNDQLRLLRPAEQRALLDRFAGDAVAEPLTRYRAVRAEWLQIAAELVERRDGARRLAQEADLLRHGLTEITAVDPQPGEDVELVAQARRLAEADDLRAVAAAAQIALVGVEDIPDAPAALALIGEARHRLAAADDGELSALDAQLAEALALLGDVGAELAGYLDRLDADPERLAVVLSRQAELKALTRKYAADVDGVLAWAAAARERLGSLDVSDEALAALTARRDGLAVELADHAAAVTAARTEAAARLAADTTAELGGLAMADARLLVTVTQRAATAGADDAVRDRTTGAHGGGRWRRRGRAAPRRARRSVAAAAAQGRVRGRAVPGDARARSGARGGRPGADDGVRRSRRGRWRSGRGRDRATARAAGHPAPGDRRHPPAAGRGVRRSPPGGRQVPPRRGRGAKPRPHPRRGRAHRRARQDAGRARRHRHRPRARGGTPGGGTLPPRRRPRPRPLTNARSHRRGRRAFRELSVPGVTVCA